MESGFTYWTAVQNATTVRTTPAKTGGTGKLRYLPTLQPIHR
jgi:hypothetical protein